MGQRGIATKDRPAKAPNCAAGAAGAVAAADSADRALAETATGKMSGYTRRGLDGKRTKAFMDKGDARNKRHHGIISPKKEERGQVRVVFQLSLLGASMPILCSTPPRCLCLAGQALVASREWRRTRRGKITVTKTALLGAGAAYCSSSSNSRSPPSLYSRSPTRSEIFYFSVPSDYAFSIPKSSGSSLVAFSETEPPSSLAKGRQCGRARNVAA